MITMKIELHVGPPCVVKLINYMFFAPIFFFFFKTRHVFREQTGPFLMVAPLSEVIMKFCDNRV